jgi:hypothetical protein
MHFTSNHFYYSKFLWYLYIMYVHRLLFLMNPFLIYHYHHQYIGNVVDPLSVIEGGGNQIEKPLSNTIIIIINTTIYMCIYIYIYIYIYIFI